MSSSLVDKLLDKLESDDETERRYAVEDLGELRNTRAIRALVKAMKDPVVGVREAAVDSLIAIGGQEVCKNVIPLLDSDEAALRNYAIEILKELGPDSIDDIKGLCKADSSDIRKFALDILADIGEISDVDAFGIIVDMLDDSNVNVSAAAAEALGKIGDPAALPALLDHMDGPPWLQCNCINAMAQIGGQRAKEALKGIAVDRLSTEARYYYSLAKDILGIR